MQDIHSSVILNEEKQIGNSCMFRITRMAKEGVKHIDFEAPVGVASKKEVNCTLKLLHMYVFGVF